MIAEKESPSSELRKSFSDQLDRQLIPDRGDVDQDSSFITLANFNRPSEQSIEISRQADRMLQAAKTLHNRFSAIPTMNHTIPYSLMNYYFYEIALKQNQYRQTDRPQARDVLVGRTLSVTGRASTEQLTELATILAAVRCSTWAALARHTDVFCHRITWMVGGQFQIKFHKS